MRRTPRTLTPRSGFTLIELLVVILIVGILIALLVPAIAAAVRTAQDARVSAEIANLQTALADFKNKYGEYPPSRIILRNDGNYSPIDPTVLQIPGAPEDISMGALNLRSARYMQKFFNRANFFFSTSGSPGSPLNWDGTGTYKAYSNPNTVILQGHECLVFFLGGMPQKVVLNPGTPQAIVQSWSGFGWSKSPTDPFDIVNPNTTVVSQNRTQPLFEFLPGRLQDIFSLPLGLPSNFTVGGVPQFTIAQGLQNGYPSYVDSLSSTTAPRPYTYFSSYGNSAYDPNDDNSGGLGTMTDPTSQELDDTQTSLISREYVLTYPPGNPFSYGPNPYTNSDPGLQNVSWVNPQSFQLFSSGRDGQWGIGGIYSPNTTGSRLPITANDGPPTGANVLPKGEALSLRTRERDNITNFSGGKLD
jgi:prepilin-type N-terminal cleavage/methylation domain-containing protein